MARQQRVVIVGASLSGAHTALQLRALGHDGPVTVVGAEPHLPYERPGLSKGYLTGALDRDALLIRPAAVYAEQQIDLQLGTRVTGLLPEAGQVLLDSGAALPYDVVVAATGSVNIRPRLAGIELPGVYQLRTLDDASVLREAAYRARRMVIIGAGFIGCELAATFRSLGLEVTAVDALPGPLFSVMGSELSSLVRSWHEEHGVRILGGVAVSGIEGGPSVESVRLDDGQQLEADLVVVGVGARPALDWLADLTLDYADGGLAVDEQGRADLPGLYAVGDVAAYRQAATGEHRRLEHYNSAVSQAGRVAAAILELPPPAAKPSTFWSEQYEHYLQYAGHHASGDTLVVRPDPYAAFFLRDQVLTAIATVNNGRDLRRALRLLGQAVDPLQLADPSTDLRTVA